MADNNLPQSSQIKKSGFSNFMSRLFGWTRSNKNSVTFTQVDIGSDERIGQALLNDVTKLSEPKSETLDRLMNLWLTDNTDKYTELAKREQRVDQLSYAILNDPYIGRTVQLYADEACQLDEQDTIINIETPDPRMTRDMYKLLSQWGVTQTRIRATIEQLASYGDAFWANKISDKGVERIIPLQQLQVTDRIEFNPVKVLEIKKRREGAFSAFANNNYLIQKMLDDMEENNDVASMFDTKLFGFSIEKDLVVPPWSITHFRVGGESSQFYPFGTSPIIGALAPFKQISSTIALQSLSRIMSFPVTLYKVKTSDAMDPGAQFETVNAVRQAYDNIGVKPTSGNNEVYTVNTKIWVPDGLLDVDVKESKVETGDTDDIEIYQNRVAVSLGIPPSYFSEEWYGFGTSGKSLKQQYKPFGRKVYSLQSAFLESLADLFRIHFAITGQYDFRIPFTLSMKFPAVEVDDDKNNARKDSLEVADNVIQLIRDMTGLTDEDALPIDIIRDIVGKYTFLEPSDIMKWTKNADFSGVLGGNAPSEGATSDGSSSGRGDELFDMSGGEVLGGEPTEDMEVPEIEETPPMEESTKNRLREASFIYEKKRREIYFKVLEECAVNNFRRNDRHIVVCNHLNNSMDLMLETLSNENKQSGRLQESL